MDGEKAFNGFDFHHNCLCYDQVKPVPAIQLYPFVLDGEWLLPAIWHLP